VTVAVVASLLLRGRIAEPGVEAGIAGLGIGLGALLCAASLDDRSDVWWPGLLVGAACAALASAATRSILARTRRRLDPQAAVALPFYAAGLSAAIAGLSIAGPPLALVAAGFFARLVAGGRRREGEKYAGLRILR